jgi:hypothetical protein
MTDAEFLTRLLRIAADDDDMDPGSLEFAVITGGTTHVAGDANGPLRGQVIKVPVTYWPFEKGEIVVLPEDGHREPLGAGRSTAKCDVVEERFGRDYEAAKRRSDEVKAAPDRDAFAPPA